MIAADELSGGICEGCCVDAIFEASGVIFALMGATEGGKFKDLKYLLVLSRRAYIGHRRMILFRRILHLANESVF